MTKYLLLPLLAFILFSCDQVQDQLSDTEEKNHPEGFDYGSVKNHVYKNDYFDLKLKLPESWVVQSEEQNKALMQQGKKIIAGDDKNMEAVLDASEINSATLLSIFEHELGAQVDFNSSFMLIAENIQHATAIKTGEDYLFHTKEFMKNSNMQFDEIDEDFKKASIGGKDFYLMELTLSMMGKKINQMYFSTVEKGFSLNIIVSYMNDEQKEAIDNIIRSVKFSE